MDNNRRIISVLFTLGTIFMIIGGTIAYYNWQTSEEQKTMVSFTVTNDFSCSADGGGNITTGDALLIPVEVKDSTAGNYIKREVKVYPKTLVSGVSIYMNLWLNVNSIGTGLSNSNNFRYAFTTGSNSPSDGVVSSGNFREATTGSQIQLLGDKAYTTTTTETYYLWIWLDAAETSTTTMNQTFSLSLGGICSESKSYETILLNDNVTVDLPNRLIPIVYDTTDNNTIVKTANKDNTWANYSNKEWANAVLVKESGNNTRDYYQNNTGVEVSEDDILAYYVYIPRYKYKIWTTSTSSSGSEKEIEIIFENKDTAKSTGTQVDEYITHPAFTFGNTEVNGIWVGKFETGGTATAPLIKPNIQSLVRQKPSEQFKTSKIFETSIYGLTSNIDTHMMKNSEWGAVTYLSHSRYGVNREVYINNSSEIYTGRSGGNVGGNTAINTVYTDQTSTTQYNTYGFYTWDGFLLEYDTNTKSSTRDLTKVASTTGNITGVYDMSGGASEYVIGVLADSNGNPRSGGTTSHNSGYNGMLGDVTIYKSGVDFPDSEYYDLYTTTSSLTACNGGICYGHGLSEVNKWYGDTRNFVLDSYPWLIRGGYYGSGSYAGAFYFNYSNGIASSNSAARSVLLAGS